MAEKLEWLDQEYLSHYDRQPVDSEIHYQKPFDAPKDREIFYPITEDEPEDHATYLSVNTVVGDDLDPILYMAFQILEYVLLDAPGAILKKELISAGIGQDILGSYENGILQPYFSVIAKNADGSQKEAFLKTVKGTLKKLADDGINQKSLLAGINYYEFRSREADFGNAPKGLMYGLQCLDSWLYGGDPLMHLEYEETFAFLKKAAKEGYFEELIRKYLLDNPFEAVITVSPKRGLTAIEDEKLREKLEAYKKSLGAEEIQAIVDGTKELKEYQDTPSPKEDLEKIPLLKRSDICKIMIADKPETLDSLVLPGKLKTKAKFVRSRPYYLEVVPLNVHKGLGVEAVAARYQLKKAEILGVGDGLNDLELLEASGMKVAMENGAPRLEYTVQISIPSATEVVWFLPYKLNTLLDIVIRCWASATIQGKSESSSVNSTFKAFDGAKLIASVTLVYPGPFTLTTVII